jgi:DNA helicase-2/ATP-dependent DNA helicase PcrA
MSQFDYLDNEQKNAVFSTDGIVRVMAGAGTGKTTTLQSRISYLIDSEKCNPNEILAVTFTNKAAREIKERVEKVIGEHKANKIRMGTFHALSLKLLRKYYALGGLKNSHFNILDDDDVLKLFSIASEKSKAFGHYTAPEKKSEMNEKEYESLCSISKKEFEKGFKNFVKDSKNKILRWKESGLTLEQAKSEISSRCSIQDEMFVRVYEYYQYELESRNSCDFADLILKVVSLLENNTDILDKESKRIKYLLVDEFQDTNMLQYKWLKLLSRYYGNLFVVGDLDQSLYSFRGSAPQIMENLKEETTSDISLKTNRRCTQEILDPANLLVDLNKREEPKVLNSEKSGDSVKVVYATNEFAEANQICSQINELLNKGVDVSDIAILARASHVLNPIEKALLKKGIQYTLVGGKSIVEREEVKDMIAYMKLAVDPYNDLAFERIANKPTRGLGPASIEYLLNYASNNSMSFDEVCLVTADDSSNGVIRKKAREKLSELGGFISNISNAYEMGVPPMTILSAIYNDTGYYEYLKEKKDNFTEREANVDFLHSHTQDFVDLADFLQEFSLMSDEDSLDDGVRLSTIHASKGLEFQHVFLPAWEDGIIPSARSLKETPGDVSDPWIGPPIGGCEEERRIAHVAITRAKESVTISYSDKRGNRKSKPSRFIYESGLKGNKKVKNKEVNQFSGIKFNVPKIKKINL